MTGEGQGDRERAGQVFVVAFGRDVDVVEDEAGERDGGRVFGADEAAGRRVIARTGGGAEDEGRGVVDLGDEDIEGAGDAGEGAGCGVVHAVVRDDEVDGQGFAGRIEVTVRRHVFQRRQGGIELGAGGGQCEDAGGAGHRVRRRPGQAERAGAVEGQRDREQTVGTLIDKGVDVIDAETGERDGAGVFRAAEGSERGVEITGAGTGEDERRRVVDGLDEDLGLSGRDGGGTIVLDQDVEQHHAAVAVLIRIRDIDQLGEREVDLVLGAVEHEVAVRSAGAAGGRVARTGTIDGERTCAEQPDRDGEGTGDELVDRGAIAVDRGDVDVVDVIAGDGQAGGVFKSGEDASVGEEGSTRRRSVEGDGRVVVGLSDGQREVVGAGELTVRIGIRDGRQGAAQDVVILDGDESHLAIGGDADGTLARDRGGVTGVVADATDREGRNGQGVAVDVGDIGREDVADDRRVFGDGLRAVDVGRRVVDLDGQGAGIGQGTVGDGVRDERQDAGDEAAGEARIGREGVGTIGTDVDRADRDA